MNLRSFFRSCTWHLGLCTLVTGPVHAQSRALVLRDATVVDVTDGTLLERHTVVVRGNHIVAVGPTGEIGVPAEAEIVDGTGGFVIPGLWDMHAHVDGGGPDLVEPFFKLLVANGITGIRNPWGGFLASIDSAAAAVTSGELAGPARVVTAGNLIDGPGRLWRGAQMAVEPEDGRRIVDSLHVAGAPFVKVYSTLLPEAYFAIVERARTLGIPVAGHVPSLVRAADASDAGQRSLEHLHGVLDGCSSEETAILADFRRHMEGLMAGDASRTLLQIFTERDRHALATQNDERCRALAERFTTNDTWLVPTLVTNRGGAFIRELAAAGDARARYLTPPRAWLPEANLLMSRATEEQWAAKQARYRRELDIIALMAKAAVPLLAGTDTPNPWAFPGFGLHDELELLVEAGLTPLQALQAATLNPARFFGRTDELGTVDVGRLADIVLLDGNPLEDIANTRRIRAVVVDGRLYRRAALDRLLAEVQAQNNR